MANDSVLVNLLAESKAEFVQASIWALSPSDNSFVRRWLVDRSQAQAAEEFLRTYLSAGNYPEETRSISNPYASGVRDGVYRGGRVMARLEIDPQTKAEEWFVYQELRKGFVESLVPEGGAAPSVDWSEFVLLKESGYHSNHEMPVLRLYNVAPSAAHDLVAYLNQDTFTDPVYRDDTLTGTWRRVEVFTEREEDGSYRIDVLLTDSENTSLYVRFLATSNVWKGIYHKWDADETTIAELESTIQFGATGEIVESGGKTLREAVAGRTVQWSPARRAQDTRLFELVVEIVWVAEKEIDTTTTPYGTHEVKVWVETHSAATALPSAADLAPLYDAPGKGDANYVPASPYGLWSLRRDLTGPNGTGLPVKNDDGTYDYAIVNRMIVVKDANWQVVGLGYDTERMPTKVSSSFQQVRRRIGGDFEFNRDEEGNLVGVSWNNNWSWSSTTTYSSAGGYCVYHKGVLYTSKAVASNTGKEPGVTSGWATYWSTGGAEPTAWVTGGFKARYGQWQSDWVKGHPNQTTEIIGVFNAQYKWKADNYYPLGYVVWHTGAFWERTEAGTDYVDSGSWGGVQPGSSSMWKKTLRYPTGHELSGITLFGDFTTNTIKSDGVLGFYDSTFLHLGEEDASTTDLSDAGYSKWPIVYSETEEKFYKLKWNSSSTDTTLLSPSSADGTVAAGKVVRVKYSAANPIWGYYTLHTAFPRTNAVTYYYANIAAYADFGVRGYDPSSTSTNDIWEAIAEDNIIGWIAKSGDGLYPFCRRDLYIKVLSLETVEVDWNNDWEWSAGYYPAGAVVYYGGVVYEAQSATSNAPPHADWAVTTSKSPSAYVSSGYEARYGLWNAYWMKSYKTGPAAILYSAPNALTVLGFYDSAYSYGTEADASADLSLADAKFPVIYDTASGTLKRLAWDSADTNSVDIADIGDTPAEVGTVVRARYSATDLRWSYWTIHTAGYADGNVKVYASAGPNPLTSYATRGVLNKAPASNAALWIAFDSRYVAAKIGISGDGTSPFEAPAQIQIADGSGGYAFSASARVSFYQSPIENPRMCMIYDCTKRDVGTLTLNSYFAFNPYWLAGEYRRIPESWADIPAIGTAVTTANGGASPILPLEVNEGDSNFGIQHRLVDMGDGVWAFEKKVELRGPIVADPEMAAEYAAIHAPYSGVQGGVAICFRDMSGVATVPWAGSFKDT